MIVGVPKEVKVDEFRVALLPSGAQALLGDGHRVVLQSGAGVGSGFADADYPVGVEFVEEAQVVYELAELVFKVKEPLPEEIAWLRPGQVVFCFFHFAGSRALSEACLKQKVCAVAFETLVDESGGLPLLTPMSEVAGKLSIHKGAQFLGDPVLGRGLLLGGVSGVRPGNVVVVGGGVVGLNAAHVAAEFGAEVVVLDVCLDRLRFLDEVLPANVSTVFCDSESVRKFACEADLVVGAVLVPGAKAPWVISRDVVRGMKKGAVLVDVSIDQGGCCESSRPTSHHDPVFVVDDVVHYCVTNIPGMVSRTSSLALEHASLPFCRELAGLGVDGFMALSRGRAAAVNMRDGVLLCEAVKEVFGDL